MSSDKPRESDPLAPHRGRLLGLAYRMLGSRSDADDVVQDAYIRFAGAQDVHNPEAFLVTVVTRLCLDRLKSAKAQREIYVGPWLPEPVFDAEGLAADTATELADDLSFALLLALDRLSPPGARGLPASRRLRCAVLGDCPDA
jgi:RNA polymerase sigma-70 factor, ECF subfamily